MNWTKTASDSACSDKKDRYTVTAPKKMARNYLSKTGVEIEAGFNYNGGGPKAFGGASSWPVANLRVVFQEHEIEKRDEFVRALQGFLDDYFPSPSRYECNRCGVQIPHPDIDQEHGFHKHLCPSKKSYNGKPFVPAVTDGTCGGSFRAIHSHPVCDCDICSLPVCDCDMCV